MKADDAEKKLSAAAEARARGAQLTLLGDALDAIEGSSDEDLDDALASVGDDAAEDWAPDGFRTAAVSGEAVRGAMGAGADDALRDPDIIDSFPLWAFTAVLDSSTTILCSSLGEPPVVLPAGDPWWDSHSPPLHYGCRSWITPLMGGEADITGPRDVDAEEGFGGQGGYWGWAPVEADYGLVGGGGPRGTGEPVEGGPEP